LKSSPNRAASGRACDDVAAIFKVGKNDVQQAKALLTDAPDLADQVYSRATSLEKAY
jgi:hypothetical protein